MNEPRKPHPTELPVDDPHQLLDALKKQVLPCQLEAVDGVRVEGRPENYRSVHSQALTSVFFADSNEAATAYVECCERLIELNAPITDVYGNGAAAQFTGIPWPFQQAHLTQVIELADKYLAAGLLDLHSNMPGTPLTRAERKDGDGSSLEGLKPLAAAIFQEDAPLVSYLLSRGATLDLGVVYPGEPPMTAMQLADEEPNGEIKALIAERYLKDHLAEAAPASPSLRPPRRAAL